MNNCIYSLRQIRINNDFLPFYIHLSENIVIVGKTNFPSLKGNLTLSYQHAKFSRNGKNEWHVEDLDSSFGTYLNGENIGTQKMIVKPGDQIGFGAIHPNRGFVCNVSLLHIKQEKNDEFAPLTAKSENSCSVMFDLQDIPHGIASSKAGEPASKVRKLAPVDEVPEQKHSVASTIQRTLVKEERQSSSMLNRVEHDSEITCETPTMKKGSKQNAPLNMNVDSDSSDDGIIILPNSTYHSQNTFVKEEEQLSSVPNHVESDPKIMYETPRHSPTMKENSNQNTSLNMNIDSDSSNDEIIILPNSTHLTHYEVVDIWEEEAKCEESTGVTNSVPPKFKIGVRKNNVVCKQSASRSNFLLSEKINQKPRGKKKHCQKSNCNLPKQNKIPSRDPAWPVKTLITAKKPVMPDLQPNMPQNSKHVTEHTSPKSEFPALVIPDDTSSLPKTTVTCKEVNPVQGPLTVCNTSGNFIKHEDNYFNPSTSDPSTNCDDTVSDTRTCFQPSVEHGSAVSNNKGIFPPSNEGHSSLHNYQTLPASSNSIVSVFSTDEGQLQTKSSPTTNYNILEKAEPLLSNPINISNPLCLHNYQTLSVSSDVIASVSSMDEGQLHTESSPSTDSNIFEKTKPYNCHPTDSANHTVTSYQKSSNIKLEGNQRCFDAHPTNVKPLVINNSHPSADSFCWCTSPLGKPLIVNHHPNFMFSGTSGDSKALETRSENSSWNGHHQVPQYQVNPPVKNEPSTIPIMEQNQNRIQINPLSVEFQMQRIVEFEHIYLQEQCLKNEPPSSFLEGVKQLPLEFSSFSEYASSFIPMLMLEIWETLRRNSRNLCENLEVNSFCFSIVSSEISVYLTKFHCTATYNRNGFSPKTGNLILMHVWDREGRNEYAILGYIYSHCLQVSEENLWTFSVLVKSINFIPNNLINLKAKGICSILNYVKMLEALLKLESSSCSESILKRRFWSFNIRSSSAIYNLSKIVGENKSYWNILLLKTCDTQYYLISKLLENIIVTKNSGLNFLVVASSITSINQIAKKLLNINKHHWKHPLRFIIIGNAEEFHESLKANTLDHIFTLKQLRKEEDIASIKKEIKQLASSRNKNRCLEDKLRNLEKKIHDKRRSYQEKYMNDAKYDLLKRYSVVLTTLDNCIKHDNVFELGKTPFFSCCIVDDATCFTELEILGAAMHSKKLMLIENKQKSTTVLSKIAYQYGYGRSMYERFNKYKFG